MLKKLIVCFMLLSLFSVNVKAQEADEQFTSVVQNEPAPFAGYLFKPEALAKIYSDIQRDEETLRLEFDTKLNLLNLEISKLKDIHKIEIDNRDLLLQKITDSKNATILELNTKLEYQKWYTVGAFVIGAVVTGASIYYLSGLAR